MTHSTAAAPAAFRRAMSPMARSACVLALACLFGSPDIGSAQSTDEEGARAVAPAADVSKATPVAAASLEQMDELEGWMRAYAEWQAWAEQWWNRREPGWFASARERRPRPLPPSWLAGMCADLIETAGTLAHACVLLADWGHEGPPRPPSATVPRVPSETPEKTKWWERFHVDMLWPVTPGNSTAFGVVGAHASIEVAGRLQVFAAPGVMFLNLPSPRGRHWTAATHYGVGYRLVDFTIPGLRRSVTLHANVARAWLISERPSGFASSLNIAGFSISPRRQP
jgi:hypothetical protein